MSRSTPLPRIGAPASRALAAVGYRSLEDLDGVSRTTLLELHGIGPKAVKILDEAMGAEGLALAP